MSNFINNRNDLRYTYEYQQGEILGKLKDWSLELTDLLYVRVFGGQLKEIMDFVFTFENQVVSRLSDEDIEKQLVICSQYHDTFEQLSNELKLYLKRINDRYEAWCAPLLLKCRTDIIDDWSKFVSEGKLNKGNIQITRDEVKNKFLSKYNDENSIWMDYIYKVERAYGFVKGISDGMSNRASILMNINKRRMNI